MVAVRYYIPYLGREKLYGHICCPPENIGIIFLAPTDEFCLREVARASETIQVRADVLTKL